MSATAKFMFDVDFAAGAKPTEKPVPPSEHAARIAEAEKKGFRDGHAAAQREAIAEAERRTAASFERIGTAIERMTQAMDAIEQRLETEAVELALAIARKLAPELVAREPFGEIAALATECLRQLASAPHVIVRVNDALYETARSQLDDVARTRGFEGRLLVIAEPEIALGDCKIEWADGGVVRNLAETDRAVAAAVDRYLGARPKLGLPELGDITR